MSGRPRSKTEPPSPAQSPEVPPFPKRSLSGVMRKVDWRVGVALGAVFAALVAHPTTRRMFYYVQLDNAPLTLAEVILAMLLQWWKHNFESTYTATVGREGCELFYSPTWHEIEAIWNGKCYQNKRRIPDDRRIRTLLLLSRIFLSEIGHGDWGHLQNNATQLLLLGPACESAFGTRNVLMMQIVKKLVTSQMNWLVDPSTQSCGASGTVFMFYLLSAQINRKKGKVPLTLLLQMMIYLPGEFERHMSQSRTVSHNETRIGHAAHLMGAVVGAIFGFTFRK